MNFVFWGRWIVRNLCIYVWREFECFGVICGFMFLFCYFWVGEDESYDVGGSVELVWSCRGMKEMMMKEDIGV